MSALGPGLVLFALMLVIGLELALDDFRRVAREPRAVWVGTAGCVLVLPLASVALLRAVEVSPNLAAGVMLITATPGAGMSNVFTYLGGAHTALSVTLTAVASLLAVVTLPLVMVLGVRAVGGDAPAIEVPVFQLGGQLLLLVLLPIGIGMRLRQRWPEACRRLAPRLRLGTLLAVVALVAVSVGSDSSSGLFDEVRSGLLLALLWTAMGMGLGLALAGLAGLGADDRFTIGVELATKNVGLSAIVALTALESPQLAVFAGAYVAVGYPLVLGLALARRRLRRV